MAKREPDYWDEEDERLTPNDWHRRQALAQYQHLMSVMRTLWFGDKRLGYLHGGCFTKEEADNLVTIFAASGAYVKATMEGKKAGLHSAKAKNLLDEE